MPDYFVTFQPGQTKTVQRRKFDDTKVAVLYTSSRLKAKAAAFALFGQDFHEVLTELPETDTRKMIPLKIA